ncbi:MAG: hypothetical protein IPL51_05790 [Candidatus Competibacteraceae bacterium]|nr:hypothetical protein [Candidatus Competibacteraceae bacterium]
MVASDQELGEPLSAAPKMESLKAAFAPPRLFIYDPARGHIATRVSDKGFAQLAKFDVSERNLDRARRILQAAGFYPDTIAAIDPGERICLAKLLGSGELSVDWLRENWEALRAGQPDIVEIGLALGQSYTFAHQQEQAGIQDFSRAWHTETARRLANCLIKGNGSVDTDAIAVAIKQLQSDFYRLQLLRGPHGDRLPQMLETLIQDRGSREVLETIKAPASAVASDLVRATLSLPPGRAVTETDARRAALAALLAELRQDSVGSCFATSLAIKVHGDLPRLLIYDLKSLIETGKLTRTVNRSFKPSETVEFPLNPSIGLAELRQPLVIDSKGRIVQVANQKLPAPIAPHEIPGLRAALESLGLTARADMKRALREACSAPGQETGLEMILGRIVANRKLTPPAVQLRQALDAFQSQLDNRLLRAWEYTVANMAGTGWGAERVHEMAMKLQKALTHDYANYFSMTGSPLLAAYNALTDSVVEQFTQRIRLLYDASVAGAKRQDGSSSYGGFSVQYRNGQGAKWQPIASVAEFNERVGDILELIRHDLPAEIKQFDDNPIDSALRAIHKNTLLTNDLGSLRSDPLRVIAGGSAQAVVRNYFGYAARAETITLEPRHTTNRPGMRLLNWLVEKLKHYGPATPASAPICNAFHTFLLKPYAPHADGALSLASAAQAARLGEWMEKHLVAARNSLIIGDSNWARGDKHLYFALCYDPGNDDLALWETAYDGARFTLLEPLPQHWLQGEWKLFIDLNG